MVRKDQLTIVLFAFEEHKGQSNWIITKRLEMRLTKTLKEMLQIIFLRGIRRRGILLNYSGWLVSDTLVVVLNA